jgi:predicted nucleotidyltransferase
MPGRGLLGAKTHRPNHLMKLKPHDNARPVRWYRGADIPTRVIRRFARQVAERFHPDKIILFGSYAYGTPHADSDVDILIIMPARNELDQAVRIRLAVDYNFPMDLLVRTPKNLSWRLAEGDSFLKEIIARGKVLYEKNDPRVGAKAEVDYHAARKLARSRPAMHDLVRFCCQQLTEKYLKAVLNQQGLSATKKFRRAPWWRWFGLFDE